MNQESRASTSSNGHPRAFSSRLPAALGLVGIAFLSSVNLGSTQAQTPLPPSRVDATNFTVELTPSGIYRAGTPAFVKLTVTAKSPYAPAREFPWTFKLLNPPSNKVRYTKMILTNAQATFTDTAASFPVGIVPIEAGLGTIYGTAHFKLCAPASPTNCVTNYVNVSVTVPVEARLPRVDDTATDKAGEAPK